MAAQYLIKTAKIIGVPTDEAWLQVFVTKTVTGKEMLVGIILKETEGVEAVDRAREILAQIQKNSDKTLVERRVICDDLLTNNKGLEVIWGVVEKECFEVVVGGRFGMLCQREGEIGYIIKPGEAETRIYSGRLQAEDFFVLATSDFFGLAGMGVTRAALGTGDVEEAKEILTPVVVQKVDNQPVVGAILMRVEEERVEPEGVERIPIEEPEKESQTGVNEAVLAKEKPLWLIRLVVLKDKLIRPARGGYFVGRKTHRRRVLIIGMAILLAVGGLGAIKWRNDSKTRGYNNLVTQIEAGLHQAEKVIVDNPKEGKTMLAQTGSDIEKLTNYGDLGKQKKEELTKILRDLEKTVEATGQGIPEMWLDLTLVKDGTVISAMTVFQGKVMALDKDKKVLFEVNGQTKGQKSWQLPKAVTLLAAGESRLYLLGKDGVYSWENSSLKSVNSDDWSTAVTTATFGDNLYVLDGQSGEIWKYPATKDGLSGKTRWLTGGVVVKGGVSMDADTRLWLGGDDKIRLFNQGKEVSFQPKKLPKSFEKIEFLATDNAIGSIYVIDVATRQVVILTKDGSFVGNYTWEELKATQGLAIDVVAKKLFIGVGGKLYFYQLKS